MTLANLKQIGELMVGGDVLQGAQGSDAVTPVVNVPNAAQKDNTPMLG